MADGVSLKAELSIDSVLDKLANFDSPLGLAIEKEVKNSGLAVQNLARRHVQKGPKTGKIYKRGKTRIHVASAPGESPATDEGNLVANILNISRGKKITVGAIDVEYAPILELGKRTQASGDVPGPDDRPFLSRALEDERSNIERRFSNLVSRFVEA